jgi:hypothetical protein
MMNGHVRRALSASLITAALAGPASIGPAAADPDSVAIDAVYKVALNDFEIGSFAFKSDVGAKQYSLESDVRISFAGLVGWKGQTRTQGVVAGKTPSPAIYQFNFESPAKSGSVAMNFKNSTVTGLTVLPDEPPLPGTMPITAEHIKNVSDPLSAVLSLVRVDGPNPCDRKVSIFDGKQRFDLVLSYRKQVPITEAQPSGQPSQGIVCRVKYVPIAGYRETEELRALARNTNITITFRPIPSAGLMVPHIVVIPTVAGDAVVSASRVNIKAPNQGQIALVN